MDHEGCDGCSFYHLHLQKTNFLFRIQNFVLNCRSDLQQFHKKNFTHSFIDVIFSLIISIVINFYLQVCVFRDLVHMYVNEL